LAANGVAARVGTNFRPRQLALAVAVLLPALGANADMLTGNAAERELLGSLESRKYTRAREQAEAILEDDEDSFIATWGLAEVHYWHEANLARALFLVRRARKMMERAYGEKPTGATERRWHKKVLWEEAGVLGEMDRRQEELDLMIYADGLYPPAQEDERIWPLMKLRRIDEAKAIAKRLIYSDDLNIRARAYNGLMAITEETREREKSYQWGKEALEKTQGRSCVIASNLAIAAIQTFRFDEAEKYVAAARKAEQDDCSGSPLSHLTRNYLLQGEFQKCISTFEQLKNDPMSPRMRVQFEMSRKFRMAELLYALGQLEEAEKRVTELVNAPDRVGMTSGTRQASELGSSLLYWAVIQARRGHEVERAAMRPWVEAFVIRARATTLQTSQWEKSRIAMRLFTHENLVVDAARPYYLDTNPWYAGTLIGILGPGVVRRAASEARETEPESDGAVGGYLDALEAEAAWRAGDDSEAETLALAALKRLPPKAMLLRWRLRAVLAAMALSNGHTDDPDGHLHEVLHKFPTMLRYLDVRLPVAIESSGGRGDELLDRLAQSPRLSVVDGAPFTVAVTDSEDTLSLCLRNGRGFQYGCVIKEEDDEGVEDVLDRFHDRMFSPKVELTQSDINSLDGRTGRIDADQALEEIMGK